MNSQIAVVIFSSFIPLLILGLVGWFLFRNVIKRFAARGEREDLQAAGDVTRYALASAVLKGSRFRRHVLKLAEQDYQSLAPELGLDFPLLVAASKRFEAADRGFNWVLTILLVITLLMLLDPSFGIFGWLGLCVLLVLVMFKGWRDHFTLVEPFRRENYDHQALRKSYGVEEGDTGFKDTDNVICYGTMDPFVGLGKFAGGWQVTVDLERPGRLAGETGPRPVKIDDLLRVIDYRVNGIKLSNVAVRDGLFVNGTEVAHLNGFLADKFSRPVSHVDDNIVAYFRHESDPRARSYRWFMIRDWNGELIMSYLLRVILRGQTLAIETAQLILPPVARSYREIDTLPRGGILATLRWAFSTLAKSPFTLISALFGALGHIQEIVDRVLNLEDRAERRAITHNPAYNYGARKTIREMIAATDYHVYFQFVDGRQYFQMLDKRVLDSIADYLDHAGVDTTAIREQATIVQNQSVVIQGGGNVNIGALAVGSNTAAQAGQPKKAAATVASKVAQ